jgi:putative DNA-invertase from lambdoid prophage Rac
MAGNYSFRPYPKRTRIPRKHRASTGRIWGGVLARVETERAAIYARVSTHDQQTLPMQLEAMRAYVERKGWQVTLTVEEVGSGAKTRPRREELLRAARRKEIDVIVVWRLDRWGRSLVDLIATLQELTALKVGFISLSEALDLTTPSGRAFAGMLAVFAEFERDILRDRVKAGIAQARKEGRPHGRPTKIAGKTQEIRNLARKGLSKSAIAKQLNIGRTSVRRLLGDA